MQRNSRIRNKNTARGSCRLKETVWNSCSLNFTECYSAAFEFDVVCLIPKRLVISVVLLLERVVNNPDGA